MHAALLPGAEDPKRLWRVVTLVALIHINPIDLAAGQVLRFFDHLAQAVAVIWVPRQGLGMQDELTALAAFVGGGDRDFYAELVRLVGLALADAFDLGRMPGIEFPTTLTLLLLADLRGLDER